MSGGTTGHAAFHMRYVAASKGGASADRRGLLQESMRHTSEKQTKLWAAANPNIVARDTHLNDAFVNNGKGAFVSARSVKQVVDYGDAREAKLARKLTVRETAETSDKAALTFVVFLPKSMCKESGEKYPVLDDQGEPLMNADGTPRMRARLVPKNIRKARQYFRDVVDFLGEEVLPGGQAAIHGYATNFDESTPHLQVMADPFADYEKKPGKLCTKYSHAFGAHRDVRDPETGKMLSREAKLRSYQKRLREHMIELGYPVEFEAKGDALSLAKDEFVELRDREHAVEVAAEVLAAQEAALNAQAAKLNDAARDAAREVRLQWDEVEAQRQELVDRDSRLRAAEAELEDEQLAWPRRRRSLIQEAKAEGIAAARKIEEAARAKQAEHERLLQQQRDQMPMIFQNYLERFPQVADHYEKYRKARFAEFAEAARAKYRHVGGDIVFSEEDFKRFEVEGEAEAWEQLAVDVERELRERQYGD